MAAVERALVAHGWHLPRWRTTNKEYGKFCQPSIPASSSTKVDLLPPSLLQPHPRQVHHVVDYPNCSAQCRPRMPAPPTNHVQQVPSYSSLHHLAVAPAAAAAAAAAGPPFVRSSAMGDQQKGYGTSNAHDQDLTLPTSGRGQPSCTRECIPADAESHAASISDHHGDRPPWTPRPLKPMILFEKIARAMEKEKAMERLNPSYKRKKCGEWLQSPPSSRPNKRPHLQDTDMAPPSTNREAHYSTLEDVHPATRRYSYYKYYGYGGQGAKTSWAHNRPLGQKPPFSRKTRELLDS